MVMDGAGALQGFHIDKQSLAVTQLWSSVYAAPGVGILEIAARNPSEHVYSPAKVCTSATRCAHAFIRDVPSDVQIPWPCQGYYP